MPLLVLLIFAVAAGLTVGFATWLLSEDPGGCHLRRQRPRAQLASQLEVTVVFALSWKRDSTRPPRRVSR